MVSPRSNTTGFRASVCAGSVSTIMQLTDQGETCDF